MSSKGDKNAPDQRHSGKASQSHQIGDELAGRRGSGKTHRRWGGRRASGKSRRNSIRIKRLSIKGAEIEKEYEREVLQMASDIVHERTQTWNFARDSSGSEHNLPRFHLSELELGRMLGRGGFCIVKEIESVQLSDEICDDTAASTKNASSLYDRSYIASSYTLDGGARFCVKKLSNETCEQKERYLKGLVDLATELQILTVLKHPNIIRTWGKSQGDLIQKDIFIIIDKLCDTMKARLIKWKLDADKPWNRMMKKKSKKLYADRVVVAHHLSSAFKYIHSKRIIYRDLKPENIGFDVKGDVKLFDFGLAKELPCTGDDSENTLYKLSRKTGSVLFMAPEVMLGKPYNQKVDVYSFSILLWEMLTLKIPFAGYSVSMHRKKVAESGERPKIPDKLSSNIKGLLSKCWSEKIEERLFFEEINALLASEVSKEV